jgi:hypothetical protein
MIDEYIKNIPKAVQNIIYDGIWENKTIEIGKKYGLNDNQIDVLTNYVVLVLIGLEKPENFLEKIISDLNISKLLAEQIVEDLENRVFEYALKQIEGDDVKVESKTPEIKPIIPEIRPDNLPARVLNVPVEMSKPVFQNEVLDSQKTLRPPVVGVPRYATGDTIKSGVSTPSGNIIENKLNNITTGVAKPEIKYQKDPYREPLN